jgi:hypothetical protein
MVGSWVWRIAEAVAVIVTTTLALPFGPTVTELGVTEKLTPGISDDGA